MSTITLPTGHTSVIVNIRNIVLVESNGLGSKVTLDITDENGDAKVITTSLSISTIESAMKEFFDSQKKQ